MLAAFTAGLLLITISELGDKTFFIAMLLAMRHSRRLVFLGVTAALAAMTVLSVLMGQVVMLLPRQLVYGVEVSLFLGFGFKLLYDASRMPAKPTCNEVKSAEATIAHSNLSPIGLASPWRVLLQSFGLTFVAEWGDRTQFATIALAAANHPIGVTLGAILGHAICAAIAVIGGRLIAGRISERIITAIGGLLFVVFGVLAAAEGG